MFLTFASALYGATEDSSPTSPSSCCSPTRPRRVADKTLAAPESARSATRRECPSIAAARSTEGECLEAENGETRMSETGFAVKVLKCVSITIGFTFQSN